jgi:hypothetical protein
VTGGRFWRGAGTVPWSPVRHSEGMLARHRFGAEPALACEGGWPCWDSQGKEWRCRRPSAAAARVRGASRWPDRVGGRAPASDVPNGFLLGSYVRGAVNVTAARLVLNVARSLQDRGVSPTTASRELGEIGAERLKLWGCGRSRQRRRHRATGRHFGFWQCRRLEMLFEGSALNRATRRR